MQAIYETHILNFELRRGGAENLRMDKKGLKMDRNQVHMWKARLEKIVEFQSAQFKKMLICP